MRGLFFFETYINEVEIGKVFSNQLLKLKIGFNFRSSCGEVLNYISHFYALILLLLCVNVKIATNFKKPEHLTKSTLHNWKDNKYDLGA